MRELARNIGIPDRMVGKPPSAGLWAGQTDEGDMGVSYEDLDGILMGFERGMRHQDIAARTGLNVDLVEGIWQKHVGSVHKRKMPLIPKIGVRTVGLDWRE